MNTRFLHYLKIVACIHIAVVLICASWAGWHRLFRKKPELVVPIEFVVDVTPPMPVVEDILPHLPEEKPRDIPEPDAKPRPRPKPKPKPRPKIEKGRKIKRAPKKKSTPKLSAEEIRKLLAAGAKPSDHTSVPDEDARCLSIIRERLYSAWAQPSSEAVGNSVAVLFLRLSRNGDVLKTGLDKHSGNTQLDDSVLAAGKSVRHISGLTAAFLKRYPTVTISFRVE